MAKTLCQAHADEKRRRGKLPDRGHIHENERNLGRSKSIEDHFFIKDPPNDGPFKDYCLLLSLILARAKQKFKEHRESSKKKKKVRSKALPDNFNWRQIGERIRGNDIAKKKTARNNLEKTMNFLLRKCPELRGNKLDDVIPKFCEYYKDVNVFVICPEFSLKKFKYTYPAEGACLDRKYQIFLYQERVSEDVFHIKYIDSIKRFAEKYGGLECIFGCNKICKDFQAQHPNCKIKTCDNCKFPIEPNGFFSEGKKNLLKVYHCDGLNSEKITCEKCNIELGSKKCFERHKKKKCGEKYKCKTCKKMVYPKKKKARHKCGEKRCIYCDDLLISRIPKKISSLDFIETIHQCPYQRAKLPTKLPNLGFFTLAIGEKSSCKSCQEKKKGCKLHENLENEIKIEAYAVAMSYELKNHEEFRMKKWIVNVDDPINQNMGTHPYLTTSVQNRRPLTKKVLPRNVGKKPEKIRPSKVENCMKTALKYVKNLDTPIWKFLRHILQKRFINYVFVCDNDTEMKEVLNELKNQNIPITAIGKNTLIHITSFNIRIISRQRFIAGKLLIIANAYGIDFSNFYSLPVM